MPRSSLAAALVVASAVLAAPVSATTPVVRSGAGLTAPSGMAVAPNGEIWVADGELGACRVANGSLVQDGVTCGPEGTTTAGPAGASDVLFASSPAGTFLYVTDPSSSNSGIWRLPYDTATGLASPGVRILGTGDSRPMALVLNPAGALEYTIKRDTRIRRIPSPDVCGPGLTPCAAALVADPAVEITSLAYLAAALLFPADTGLQTIGDPSGGNPTATPADAFPLGLYGAVTTDAATARVYAGTADPSNARILVREGDAPTTHTYASGFSGITAMAVAADGTLLVADDPSRAAGATESVGQGRIFAVEPHPADLPEAAIISVPAPVIRDATASFEIAGSDDVSFECRVDPADWSPCGTGPQATTTIDLPADGTYTFQVRALRGTVSGAASTYVVTRDTVAPIATIDTRETSFASDAVRVAFSADEPLVAWTCALDGGVGRPCASPFRPLGLLPGPHEVVITPTDPAGNTGPSIRHAFEVLAPPPAAPEEQGEDLEVLAPAPVMRKAEPVAPEPARTVAGAAGSTTVRCRPVIADRSAPRFVPGPRRSFVVRARSPRGARWAKLTVRHRSGPTRGELVKVKAARVATPAGQVLRITGRFSPTTYRLLRSGRYRLGVAFGTCPTTVGGARIAVRAGAWRGPVR